MDRRGNPETEDRHRDIQLQKAVDVILDSYRGGEPDRLYRDAVACFETLMEISRKSDAIQDFSRREGRDLKYLVDGANFVISRMHFNTENNHYLTLGLSRNAHQDEIRERWKSLMMLYHPDRQAGNEEWGSELAKKVNEAYSALKDEQKRSAYDQQLAEAALRQDQALQRHKYPLRTRLMRAQESISAAGLSEGPLRSLRKHFTGMLAAFYLLCVLGVLGFIYLQNREPDLESRLVPDQKVAPVRPEQAPPERSSLQDMSLLPEQNRAVKQDFGEDDRFVQTGPVKDREGKQRNEAALYPDIRPDIGKKESAVQILQEKEKKQPDGVQTKMVPVSPAVREAADKKPADALPGRLPKPVMPPPVAPVQVRATEPKQPDQDKEVFAKAAVALPVKAPEKKTAPHAVQEPRPQQNAKVPAPAGPINGALTREEVEAFMQRYIRAYEKGDIDLIMSLFSRTAVENNVLRYDDIRNAYRMAFDGKINHYRLRDLDIRLDGGSALVSGVYSISRYTSADDRWMKFDGRITWKLLREPDALKIVTLNYDK